ncbi:MAG TPA: SpoIIE family protein phosphatase [Candidatus Sulfopaludibacter sp.]|nr:SpoIIE family protein phosphatase [Candidatus Sulfopaludibacter sp.]
MAAIDGIGHGEEAILAAQTAAGVLIEHKQESVISLVRRCHEKLTKTRGVVMTVASLHALEGTLTWLGVGNVEGRLLRAEPGIGHPKENVLLRSGLVGYQLPVLQASVVPLSAGDVVILATDGIRPGFAEGINLKESPKHIAENILHRYFNGIDDALVLVSRYLGLAHE